MDFSDTDRLAAGAAISRVLHRELPEDIGNHDPQGPSQVPASHRSHVASVEKVTLPPVVARADDPARISEKLEGYFRAVARISSRVSALHL